MCIKAYLIFYVILLAYSWGYVAHIYRYTPGSDTIQKLTSSILLHLLLRGDILCNGVRLIQNQIYLVKTLLIKGNPKAFVVYGSPYINKQSTFLSTVNVSVA